MSDKNIIYYTEATHISSVEGYEAYLDDVPDEIHLIIQVIQGLLIHDSWLEHYKVKEKSENTPNTPRLTARDILHTITKIDNRSFLIPRGIEGRTIVCCRDFSLLLCSILRYKKIPCRIRAGFASYLAPPDMFEDHWICEYWDAFEETWVRVDPQIDLFQHKMIREWTNHYNDPQYTKMINKFDNLNIKECDFYTAGEIWNLVKNKKTNPMQYGLYFDPESFGINFIKANLLRDFACLSKDEPRVNYMKNTPLWKKWVFSNKPFDTLNQDEIKLLDTIATYSQKKEIDVSQIINLYADNRKIQVPEENDL